jgi:hypothetical protein
VTPRLSFTTAMAPCCSTVMVSIVVLLLYDTD